MNDRATSTAAEEREGQSLSRRGFLTAAATVALGAGAAMATGCAPAAPGELSATGDGSSAPGGSGAPDGLVGGAICPEDWLGEMPVIDEADVYETVDVDVVVLGGGHAGTQAALSAAQNGASVAVVEMQDEQNYIYFGEDICSYNSQFLINRGFGPYDTGEITSEYVRRAVGRVSPTIIGLFVENSGEMMDNLVSLTPDTSNAFDFDDDQCIIQIAYNKPDGKEYPTMLAGYKTWPATYQTQGTVANTQLIEGREEMSRITELETYCLREAERLGATWYWRHTAAALVMDGDAVAGAYAKGPDGKYLKLNAKKGVLLACGDFSANEDMVYNLLDDVAEWTMRAGGDRSALAGMGRDGMGHKLGCWAGGSIEPHPRPSNNTLGGMPGPWGTCSFFMVNEHGKRFMNEAMAQLVSANCMRQPLGKIAAIADADYMKTVQAATLDHGAPNWGSPSTVKTMEDAISAMQPGPEGAVIPQCGIVKKAGGASVAAIGGGAGMGEPDAAAAPDGVPAGGAPADGAPDAGAPEGDAPSGMGPMGGSGPMGDGGPNLWCANTVEELLGYLGYEGDALKTALAEVDRYNKLCHAGADTDFGKDASVLFPIEKAPFYGSVTENSGIANAGLVTLAGLLTDENLNVMKVDRSAPIKGLYAAGNCLGQRYGMGYCTPSAGNSVGMAMTHGRVVGKIMAAL